MPIHVVGSREDRFKARQLQLARERLSDAVESTELPGARRLKARVAEPVAEIV